MSTKITFRERGQGEVLILLHGYGGGVQHWETVAQSLMPHFRVVLPNLSHLYLSSDKVVFAEQVKIFANFIRDHFPNQKVALGGFSYGGALTWALANTYPELVSNVVLVNPMVADPVRFFQPLELKFFFNVPLNLKSVFLMLSTPMGRTFLKRAAQIFRDERTEGNVAIENLQGRKLQFVAHLIHNFSWILRSENWIQWNVRLKKYRCNTRIIFDTEDLLFSKETYHQFAKTLGCDDVISLTGGGHLVIKTRPENVAKHMREFLEQSVKAA